MEAFKGTKGEWRYDEYFNEITTSPGGRIDTKGTVCSLATYHNKIDVISANGKLIASALKLLEALQNLVKVVSDGNMLENEYYEEWEEDLKKAVDLAETAIKQATE